MIVIRMIMIIAGAMRSAYKMHDYSKVTPPLPPFGLSVGLAPNNNYISPHTSHVTRHTSHVTRHT